MAVAFIHFLANLIIALALIRLLEQWMVKTYGSDNPLTRALAFVH